VASENLSGSSAGAAARGKASTERSFEVELEMTAAGRARWLAVAGGGAGAEAEAEAACAALARQLCTWLDLVNAPTAEAPDPGRSVLTPLAGPGDERARAALRVMCAPPQKKKKEHTET
jgi:hypothetical protein